MLATVFIATNAALDKNRDAKQVAKRLEELSQLQDQLPGFDGNKAMQLIEEDLSIEEKNSCKFSPFASACAIFNKSIIFKPVIIIYK